MRGMVARIHTNKVANNIVLTTRITLLSELRAPQKIVAVISLNIKMFVYSAMKIMANRPLLNSVLNPDTSSDSPSAKSNGVRLVSARQVINHITATGAITMNSQE
jgi:hypothetical protein